MNLPNAFRIRFPEGKPKALVMSYDDGSEHDRRLIGIFNHFGIKASFHLNSGTLGEPHRVARDEIKGLYDGHEVSCHTVSHPDLTCLSDDGIRREVAEDRQALEALVGKPVRGLAYPFGTYDERVIAVLDALGLDYARTIENSQGFALPRELLALPTTCHHNQAMEIADRWLHGQSGSAPQLMYVWGHSYEFDGFMSADRTKDWRYIEDFCRLVGNQAAVYYATTIAIVDYLQAARRLAYLKSEQAIANPSDTAVWIAFRGQTIEIAARSHLYLAA